MNFKFALVVGSTIATLLFSALSAQALVIIKQPITYNITLNNGISAVYDILIIQKQAGAPAGSYAYGWNGLSLSSGQSSFTYKATVPQQYPVVSTLALGWTKNLPGDPSGVETDHLVVLGNFASSQIGQSYNALFPDATHESELITDLQSIFIIGKPVNFDLVHSAINLDENPFAVDADALGLFAANNSNVDAVAFSTGQLIGTGFLTLSAVPEPSTWAMMLFGLFSAGLMIRRARRKVALRLAKS